MYFKLVAHVPPVAVLAHRVVWSVVFLAVIIAIQNGWRELWTAGRSRRTMLILAGSTIAVAANWLAFIYAISTDRVLQASLGYFINPLLTVALAMIFLKERLRLTQGMAIAVAGVGVAVLTVWQREVPWLALSMALSFGVYGLLRKLAPVAPVAGLMIETSLLLPVGLVIVIWQLSHDASASGNDALLRTHPLLMLAGVVTALPLLAFAAAARRLRLTTLGFLQYVGPTCQLLLAVLLYDEPFTTVHAICFGCIWLALLIYSVGTARAYRERMTASRETGKDALAPVAALPE